MQSRGIAGITLTEIQQCNNRKLCQNKKENQAFFDLKKKGINKDKRKKID